MTENPRSDAQINRLRPAVKRLWTAFYPNYRENDFERHIASIVQPNMKVLEIGAGSGTGMQNAFLLKDRCALYVGIDVDPRILDNPFLDQAHVADATELPFGDESFDLVFHKMVAEHLDAPEAALTEIARVLKRGGRLLFETPNRLYYPMIIARWTPTTFHRFFIDRFASGRSDSEVFPTFYRLNDRRTIDRWCRQAHLTPEITFRTNPPGYLRFNAPAFLLGVLYERTVEQMFPSLRGVIWVDARKGELEDVLPNPRTQV